jgi:ATP-dependent DNA helicase RecG
MRKMMLYGKKYGGADPQLIEGDIFRMIISVPEFDQLDHSSVAAGDRGQIEAQKVSPSISTESSGKSSGKSSGENLGTYAFQRHYQHSRDCFSHRYQ